MIKNYLTYHKANKFMYSMSYVYMAPFAVFIALGYYGLGAACMLVSFMCLETSFLYVKKAEREMDTIVENLADKILYKLGK